jgi:hypothetical protein
VIVDTCLFAGEREMLQLRMLTLGTLVDAYAVVACTITHQGEPADVGLISGAFHEATAAARLPVPSVLSWVEPSMILERNGRILERAPDERGPAGTPWFQHIERQHRDGMAGAVRMISDDPQTVVMMSDVDEIPTPECVAQWHAWPMHEPETLNARLVCAQRFHSTALDLLHPQQPWWGTCVSLLGHCQPQKHRDDRGTIGTPKQSVYVVDRGGWHFSWFGTDVDRARKLATFSHAELTGKYDPLVGRVEQKHSNGEQLVKLNVAETLALDWPAPLVDGSMPLPEYWVTDDVWRPA